MMSTSSGEGCKDGIKYPSLSSPNRYALRSKSPLPQPQPQKEESPLPQPQKEEESPLPQPQKEEESPLPQPQKEEESPLPQPQKEEESPLPQPQKEKEEESPLPQPKKRKLRSGPRCIYPRRRQLPPGMAPAFDYRENPFSEDPENIPILEIPELLDLSAVFAEGALSYLSQQGHHFKLFRLDFYEGGTVGGGARFHHNFLAKPAHDPDAPPETIFSQVFLKKDRKLGGLTDLTVECCVSLGPSHSLPKKRDSRGCAFCTIYIHHPKDGCEGMIC